MDKTPRMAGQPLDGRGQLKVTRKELQSAGQGVWGVGDQAIRQLPAGRGALLSLIAYRCRRLDRSQGCSRQLRSFLDACLICPVVGSALRSATAAISAQHVVVFVSRVKKKSGPAQGPLQSNAEKILARRGGRRPSLPAHPGNPRNPSRPRQPPLPSHQPLPEPGSFRCLRYRNLRRSCRDRRRA